MQRSIRQKLIVQTVRGSGRIRIDQLAELTGASAVTIRRDLADLEAHGSLRRTRGGAARAAKFGEGVSYRIRAGEDQQAKARLAEAAGARVSVPGGPVEPDTLALYGSQAVDAVRAISAAVVLIGSCSVSATRGLTSATYEDAQLKRASIHVASKTILVATGAKLNQTSNFRFGGAADIAHLITTADAPDEVLAAFQAEGVHLTLI